MFKELAKKLVDTFTAWRQRRVRMAHLARKIAPMAKELKELAQAQAVDEAGLVEMVKSTGTIDVQANVLSIETADGKPKRTVVSAQELLEAIATHAPKLAERTAEIYQLVEDEKRAENAKDVEPVLTLKVDPIPTGSAERKLLNRVKNVAGEWDFVMQKAA